MPDLLFLDGSDGDRALVRKVVGSCRQSVIYGEDRTLTSIYDATPLPAGHKAIGYWTGRSTAWVLPDADLEAAARSVVWGAAEDRGNRCVSTKKLFIPAGLLGDFLPFLVRQADRLGRGDRLDPATDIGTLDPVARKLAESAALEGEVLYDRDLLVVRTSEHSALFREELSYPVLAVRPYGPGEDPIALMNEAVADTAAGRMLVLSVFTASAGTYEQAAARALACKVNWNRATTHVNLATPHQGMVLCRELMRPTFLLG